MCLLAQVTTISELLLWPTWRTIWKTPYFWPKGQLNVVVTPKQNIKTWNCRTVCGAKPHIFFYLQYCLFTCFCLICNSTSKERWCCSFPKLNYISRDTTLTDVQYVSKVMINLGRYNFFSIIVFFSHTAIMLWYSSLFGWYLTWHILELL